MPDDFERASGLESLHRDFALQTQLERYNPNAPSLEYCEECGDKILEERRALGGVTKCVPCKEFEEIRGKR